MHREDVFKALNGHVSHFLYKWNHLFSADWGFSLTVDREVLSSCSGVISQTIKKVKELDETYLSPFKCLSIIGGVLLDEDDLFVYYKDDSLLNEEDVVDVVFDPYSNVFGNSLDALKHEINSRLIADIVPGLSCYLQFSNFSTQSIIEMKNWFYSSMHFRAEFIGMLREGKRSRDIHYEALQVNLREGVLDTTMLRVNRNHCLFGALALLIESQYYCHEHDSRIDPSDSIRRFGAQCIDRFTGINKRDYLGLPVLN